MADDEVTRNLKGMDELDFVGWNSADWHGVFAHYHTDDVLVDVHGQAQTHGIQEHIDAMRAFVETTGGTPIQITSHPVRFGSGDWTCVVGEFEGGRMVTVAKWRDGAIAEEYIWRAEGCSDCLPAACSSLARKQLSELERAAQT
jgi:hypothetical protein